MTTSRSVVCSYLLAATLFFGGGAHLAFADGSFSTISVPGSGYTIAYGISNAGEIVGLYGNSSAGPYMGFSLNGSTFTDPIVYPGATYTLPIGINSSGETVGSYSTGAGFSGYSQNGSVFSAINYPGVSSSTIAYGINDSGQIVGGDNALSAAFLLSGGVYTSLAYPGATSTVATGINNSGQIVGFYGGPGGTTGFLRSGGVYTSLTFPGATTTEPFKINNNGQIVGLYATGGQSSIMHGFVYSGGVYTSIDFPGASSTSALGINDSGQIVGSYAVGAVTSGFLTSAPSVNPFFATEVSLGSGAYYMVFGNGNLFGYYEFLQGSSSTANGWLYHFDMGYEYVTPGSAAGSLYLFDNTSGHWWYSSSTLFPYLYDFTLKAWIDYFPNTQNPGHYSTGPRYFANLTTSGIFTM